MKERYRTPACKLRNLRNSIGVWQSTNGRRKTRVNTDDVLVDIAKLIEVARMNEGYFCLVSDGRTIWYERHGAMKRRWSRLRRCQWHDGSLMNIIYRYPSNLSRESLFPAQHDYRPSDHRFIVRYVKSRVQFCARIRCVSENESDRFIIHIYA